MTTEFLVDISPVYKQPGTSMEVARDLQVDEKFGTVVARVKAPYKVNADLRFDSLREGVFVTGTLATDITSECVRCLDPISDHVRINIDELYEYPSEHNQDLEGDDEVRILDGEEIDLEPLLLDNLVPAFPFQPLCSDDCQGLCDYCGGRLDDGGDHEHEQLDPRWSGLEALRAQLAGEEASKAQSAPSEASGQDERVQN